MTGEGEAGLRGDGLRPRGLPPRVGRVPLRLDVHRADDPQAVPVAPEVVGQVVPPNRAVVAVPPFDRRFVTEPGMVVPIEVPEVVMCIDDDIVPATDVVDVGLIVGPKPQVRGVPLRPLVIHREASGEDVVQAEEHPPGQHQGEGVPAVPQKHVGDGDTPPERDEGDAVPRPPGADSGRPPIEGRGFIAGAPYHLREVSRSDGLERRCGRSARHPVRMSHQFSEQTCPFLPRQSRNLLKTRTQMQSISLSEAPLVDIHNQTGCGFIQIRASLRVDLSSHNGTPQDRVLRWRDIRDRLRGRHAVPGSGERWAASEIFNCI